MKDLFTENHKSLIKEIEKDTNKWRAIPCSWIERINIAEMSALPKQSTDTNQSLSNSNGIFNRIKLTILKFVWNHKRHQVAKTVLRKNKPGGTIFLDLKLYYKTITIKTVWFWHKNRHLDQWKRIENPEIHPPRYSQFIYNK